MGFFFASRHDDFSRGRKLLDADDAGSRQGAIVCR